MSRPTHLLRHEHRVIEQAIRALEGMCVRMRAGARVPPEAMAKLLDFFQGFADGFHHAKEEAYLLPALEQLGIRNEDGPLAFLWNEHAIERRLLGEVDAAIEAYRHDAAAGMQFVSAALQFKDHLIAHMQHEDATLFRLAEEMMDDQSKDSLLHALAAAGNKAQPMTQRYEQMAEELEKAWTV
jgi:hemerythrin-like domain-containing protein